VCVVDAVGGVERPKGWWQPQEERRWNPRLALELRRMRHVLEKVKEADACMEVVRTYVSEGECGRVVSRQAGTNPRGNPEQELVGHHPFRRAREPGSRSSRGGRLARQAIPFLHGTATSSALGVQRRGGLTALLAWVHLRVGAAGQHLLLWQAGPGDPAR
jgi:hypothetical protein